MPGRYADTTARTEASTFNTTPVPGKVAPPSQTTPYPIPVTFGRVSAIGRKDCTAESALTRIAIAASAIRSAKAASSPSPGKRRSRELPRLRWTTRRKAQRAVMLAARVEPDDEDTHLRSPRRGFRLEALRPITSIRQFSSVNRIPAFASSRAINFRPRAAPGVHTPPAASSRLTSFTRHSALSEIILDVEP